MEPPYVILLSHFLHANRPHPEPDEGPTSLENALGALYGLLAAYADLK